MDYPYDEVPGARTSSVLETLSPQLARDIGRTFSVRGRSDKAGSDLPPWRSPGVRRGLRVFVRALLLVGVTALTVSLLTSALFLVGLG